MNRTVSAIVLPFPAARRADLVALYARRMASVSSIEGDTLLAAYIRQEFDRQDRLGIDGDLTELDLLAFGHAVRAELWREVLLRPHGGGGAA